MRTLHQLRVCTSYVSPHVLHHAATRNLAGFFATCVSDCISNAIRVLKTTRQTSATTISYREAAQQIIDQDGVKGLFSRGLGTRLLANGVQASMFSVLWKAMEEQLGKRGF